MQADTGETSTQASKDTGEVTSSGQPVAAPPVFPIRFRDVILYDLSITRDPTRVTDFSTPGGSVSVELSRPLLLGAILEVAVSLKVEVPTAQAPAWIMLLKVNGVFDVDEGLPTETIDTFVSTTVLPLVWPYAREIVQNLTVRMRVMPLLLQTLDLRNVPFLSFPTPSDPRQQESSQETDNDDEGDTEAGASE